jgi:hypothetical protein
MAGDELTDTGALRKLASDPHTKQGWISSDKHRDRPHQRRDPLRVYAVRAVAFDVVAIVIAAVIGFVLRWTIPYDLNISDYTYVLFALVVVVSWIGALLVRGAYDTRILGVGSEEFKRVITASGAVFAAVAIVAFAFKLDLSRGFVLITFVVGLILLLIVRWSLRAWLRNERRYGHFLHRTVVIGTGSRSEGIVDLLDRDPVAGFTVVDVIPEPVGDGETGVVDDPTLEAWLDEVMAHLDRGCGHRGRGRQPQPGPAGDQEARLAARGSACGSARGTHAGRLRRSARDDAHAGRPPADPPG